MNGKDVNFKAYKEIEIRYTLFQFGCVALVTMWWDRCWRHMLTPLGVSSSCSKHSGYTACIFKTDHELQFQTTMLFYCSQQLTMGMKEIPDFGVI